MKALATLAALALAATALWQSCLWFQGMDKGLREDSCRRAVARGDDAALWCK